MDFVPPAAGSYRLEHIQQAADGRVLDAGGRGRRLGEFTRGKVTLLSFMYSSCADPGGCPYAFLVLHEVKQAFEKIAAAKDRLRIVSLSFDPERDTPDVMRLYAGDHAKRHRGVEWAFLTTSGPTQLMPIVDGFVQDVTRVVDPENGRTTGRFAHVLKVFLIDRRGMVREIYTTDYLLSEVVINDVKTLLMEEGLKLP